MEKKIFSSDLPDLRNPQTNRDWKKKELKINIMRKQQQQKKKKKKT